MKKDIRAVSTYPRIVLGAHSAAYTGVVLDLAPVIVVH